MKRITAFELYKKAEKENLSDDELKKLLIDNGIIVKQTQKMENNLKYWTQLGFDALIQNGIENGANIVNGMPWSWKINGKSVTHERDDLYLVECVDGIRRFEKGDQIRVVANGLEFLPYHLPYDHAPGSCPL